jgi:sarcosine oxidase, subunit gamma
MKGVMSGPTAYRRRSFVYRRLLASGMCFTDLGDAALAKSATASVSDGNTLQLVDLSVLPRWGLKGRAVFSWLGARGAITPETNHRAIRQLDGTLIARLSPGEALVLAPAPSGRSMVGAAIDQIPPAGDGACYPVPRRDSHAWFLIVGDDASRMFAKLCSVDLSADRFTDCQIAQTSVARLSAIVIRNDLSGCLAFSLLADSSSAEYLWDCLLDAMAEFRGAVAGAECLGFAGGADKHQGCK